MRECLKELLEGPKPCPACSAPVAVGYAHGRPAKWPRRCPHCKVGLKMMVATGEEDSIFHFVIVAKPARG